MPETQPFYIPADINAQFYDSHPIIIPVEYNNIMLCSDEFRAGFGLSEADFEYCLANPDSCCAKQPKHGVVLLKVTMLDTLRSANLCCIVIFFPGGCAMLK